MSDNLMRAVKRFSWHTTVELEQALEHHDLSHEDRNQIEYTLMQRRKSWFNAPTTVYGSDGSALTIGTAGEHRKGAIDWDGIIAAESAYVDEIMAKPFPKVSSVDLSKFYKRQTAIVRKVVPGLIAMDITGVQPMFKPQFNTTLTKADIDNIIAADKDLQPLKSRYYDTQQIGRALREPSHFSDIRTIDYMGLMRTNEMPKTNIGLTALMDSIKESGATQASFFDTESTFDTSSWFAQHKADTDKYIEDALSRPNRFIMNDDIKYMYPADINLCCETSISPVSKGTEVTNFDPEFTTSLWDTYLSAMRKATRELYGVKVGRPAIVTAKAPDFSSSMMMDAASGIEPIRGPRMQDFFVGEMKAYQPDIMIHATAPVEESPTFEMKVLKNREYGVGTVLVDFKVEACAGWGKWATLAEQPDPEETRVSETLALLGIGEPQ